MPQPAKTPDRVIHPDIALSASRSFTWEFDSTTGTIVCSDHCKDALGISTESSPTLAAMAELLHPDDRSRVLDLIEDCFSPVTCCSAEFRIRRREGHYQWILMRGGVVNRPGTGPLRIAGIVMQLDEKSSDRNRVLAQLSSKNRELEVVNSELKQATSDVQQFAFSASHDFREPLRHLSIYSEILRRKSSSGLDSEARLCLYFVLSSARRIESLIRDLLAYTQLTYDGLTYEPVNTNDIVAEVVSSIGENAAVEIEPLPSLWVNESHLGQLFRHLLENAIKYRRPDVPPKIRIFAREGQDGPVICVKDNGIGIAPEHRTQIFGLFKRLHRAADYEGTGIGLAICHKIVERYGGRIWVESDAPNGSTFCFTVKSQAEVLKARSASSGGALQL